MKTKGFCVWLNNSYRPPRFLLFPAVFVGIILPFDYLTQVDGYVKYMHVVELPPVFTLAWGIYFLAGMLLSGITGVIAYVISVFSQKRQETLYDRITLAGSASFIILLIVRGIKLWCSMNGFVVAALWLSTFKWWIALGIVLVSGICVYSSLSASQWIVRMIWRLSLASALIAFMGLCLIVFSHDRFKNENAQQSASAASYPNIILVTADAFSAQHASVYGYARRTTPELEKLAQHALLYDRFYANSNFTTCAINSLINGTRPWTHRVFQIVASQNFSRQTVSLAQALNSRGYRTIAVTTNVNASPIQSGNEKWFNSCALGGVANTADIILTSLSHVSPLARTLGQLPCFSNGFEITDRILVFCGYWPPRDWHCNPKAFHTAQRLLMEGNGPQPVFLWVHLFAPHDPYATRPPFLRSFDKSMLDCTRFNSFPHAAILSAKDKEDNNLTMARYDECVACFDHDLGDFIGWLKANKLWDRSLFVFSADHGESFGHGYGSHGGPMLYEDLIRVPLIIRPPGQVEGKRVDVLAEQIDIMPTILDFVGIPIPDSCEGRSLKQLNGYGDAHEKPVFSMNFEQNSCFGPLNTGSVAMMEGRWKYIHFVGKIHSPRMPMIEDALYDLTSDQGELRNRISDYPEIAARMLQEIEVQLRIHNQPKERK